MKKVFVFSIAAICISATVNAQVDTLKKKPSKTDTLRKNPTDTSKQQQQPVSLNKVNASQASALQLTGYLYEADLRRASDVSSVKKEEVTV